jgi:3-methyladenine DNA glycosylase AlkC
MTKQPLMKDRLGTDALGRIAVSLTKVKTGFPRHAFIASALSGLEPLELKARVRHIIGALHRHLPDDFNVAADILIKLKHSHNLHGFDAWPLIDYVGEHGLGHPEKALATLKELTPLFSAEFAIRPFIIQHFGLTFQTLEKWCSDPDEHVRRLVSEGSRPRLPWGQRLPQFIKDPIPVFQLLEKLKDDPSEYVRRSVANNLNDIAKDHPETVIALCRRWQDHPTAGKTRIIRHATRSLVKAGHPEVFVLLGYTENPKLDFQSLEVSPKEIVLGGTLEFKIQLQSTNAKPQTIVIDYAIHHIKANGKTSPKVFKFQTLEIGPGETAVLAKRHPIKPITTRKYYPGEHAIEILINGKAMARAAFSLLERPI